MPSDATGTRSVREHNLGYLRLCRDDLRQIVDLVRSLPGVRIDLEADNIRLDDVETDLPKLGDQLSFFTVKAYRETEVLSVPGRGWLHAGRDRPRPNAAAGIAVPLSAPCGADGIFIIISSAMSRTVLLTGRRAESAGWRD
jgi:hypothetical protein